MSWRESLISYIRREAKPVDKYGHQPRLYALTRRIGEGLEYDDDVVFAAVWLHDLGVFVGHRPEDKDELARWDNIAYAAERAPAVLAEIGFPPEKIPFVIEAIRTHQPSADPGAIEGALLRDADILEQLGAVGILRTVCKVGRDTRFSTFTEALGQLTKALELLPSQIRLEPARVLAESRVRVLGAFVAAVRDEAGPELW